jgi:hypothetical protein
VAFFECYRARYFLSELIEPVFGGGGGCVVNSPIFAELILSDPELSPPVVFERKPNKCLPTSLVPVFPRLSLMPCSNIFQHSEKWRIVGAIGDVQTNDLFCYGAHSALRGSGSRRSEPANPSISLVAFIANIGTTTSMSGDTEDTFRHNQCIELKLTEK